MVGGRKEEREGRRDGGTEGGREVGKGCKEGGMREGGRGRKGGKETARKRESARGEAEARGAVECLEPLWGYRILRLASQAAAVSGRSLAPAPPHIRHKPCTRNKRDRRRS